MTVTRLQTQAKRSAGARTDTTAGLIDTFQRTHTYLRISLTEKCNLRCLYCMPEEGVTLTDKSHLMTYEEIIGIAKVFVKLGVNKIRLTGGEPLIRREVDVIIRALSQWPIELTLTTNGVLVDKYIDVFKEAGIKSLNVSLDSLDADKFYSMTYRDYFEKVMANIDLLQTHGFRLKINAVLIKGENDDEIIDFVDWTKDRPFEVRFIEFMPFSGNHWDMSRTVSYETIMTLVRQHFGESSVIKLDDKPHATTRGYRIKDHCGTFAVISTVTNPFCDSCNRVRLTADGKIKNCLFSSEEIDLLGAYRKGDNIEHLIRTSILRKKFERSGIKTFDDESGKLIYLQNRSMISIGG